MPHRLLDGLCSNNQSLPMQTVLDEARLGALVNGDLACSAKIAGCAENPPTMLLTVSLCFGTPMGGKQLRCTWSVAEKNNWAVAGL